MSAPVIFALVGAFLYLQLRGDLIGADVRFRFVVWKHRESPDGRRVISFGLRVGWWPCLQGPFVSLSIGRVSLDLWYGLPSYRSE